MAEQKGVQGNLIDDTGSGDIEDDDSGIQDLSELDTVAAPESSNTL